MCLHARFTIKILLIVAAISWQASAASALDTAPQFLNHKNSDFRTPLAALQIQLPNDVPEHIYKTLAFELDNIDITAVVSHANSVSSYVPLQPLTWGSHILRLVEYEEDGSISEVGYWEFDVRDSSLFQATNYSIDSNLTATQRVAEKNIGMPEPNALSGNGAALIQGELTNEHWQINANMDLVYNSESERTRTIKKWTWASS